MVIEVKPWRFCSKLVEPSQSAKENFFADQVSGRHEKWTPTKEYAVNRLG